MSVCQFVCPQHNSKTNESKGFKLGRGNDLGISYKATNDTVLGISGSQVRVRAKATAIRHGFEFYESLLVLNVFIYFR